MTPIFMRIWLMKITMQRDFEIEAVELRRAWLMRRACRPMCESPISPSSSARAQGGHAIHDQHVGWCRAHEGVGDFQGLLAGVGLGDQQARRC